MGTEPHPVEIHLGGGRANAGAVVRIGDEVARPAHPQSDYVDHFLSHLRDRGCTLGPRPLGRDLQGRQRLSWIEGVAPTSPRPDWAWDADLLVDVAQAQRELHRAARGYAPPAGAQWAVSGGDYFPEGSRPVEPGAAVFCHNDLCMANVIVDVERLVVAGFVDFDYVAPVDPLFDVAVLARHWAPFGDLDGAGLAGVDRVGRFRTICGVHDLAPVDRARVLDLALAFLERARSNVRALAEAGNPGFRAMIEDGYEETNLTTVDWIIESRSALIR